MNECIFLGIIINSKKTILELPLEKRRKIFDLLTTTLKKNIIKIEKLAELVGTLVAACPAVAYGWLYYKELEILKRKALTFCKDDMSKCIALSKQAVSELNWWKENIMFLVNKIRNYGFDLEIFSDASLTGWGAVYGNQKAQGFWNPSKSIRHINYLEILAAFLAVKSFAKNLLNCQILLRIDNLTALAYINKMGGTRFRNC